MKHSYLSKSEVAHALESHAITIQEAKKLQKKIDCQMNIYKILHT